MGKSFSYLCNVEFHGLKKLFSSVFIVLVLLNVAGYYGILMALKHKNARDLMAQFDAGLYNPEEATVIKIPFKTSASQSSEEFERVDGDFERDGEVYRLIKQRLYRDTFHIVYMKDKTGTIINKVISDYVKTFGDTPDDDDNTFLLPVFLKEYFIRSTEVQCHTFGWQQSLQKNNVTTVYIDDYVASITHPPQLG